MNGKLKHLSYNKFRDYKLSESPNILYGGINTNLQLKTLLITLGHQSHKRLSQHKELHTINYLLAMIN